MSRFIYALLMLWSINAVAAQVDNELQRLRSALDLLNQEQQSIYQQFQMVQELRRSTVQQPVCTLLPSIQGAEIANYDDVVAAQNNATRRKDELSLQARRLFDRYGEIEEEKKPLQQQIIKLMSGKK